MEYLNDEIVDLYVRIFLFQFRFFTRLEREPTSLGWPLSNKEHSLCDFFQEETHFMKKVSETFLQ